LVKRAEFELRCGLMAGTTRNGGGIKHLCAAAIEPKRANRGR
jgi:hypothetical protein